jgi:hypothetical protein
MPTSKPHLGQRSSVRNTKSILTRSVISFFLLTALSVLSVAGPAAISGADPQRYLEDIKALTTPAMEGRGAGSKGLTRAEHLIEKRYKSLGLEPAGTTPICSPSP